MTDFTYSYNEEKLLRDLIVLESKEEIEGIPKDVFLPILWGSILLSSRNSVKRSEIIYNGYVEAVYKKNIGILDLNYEKLSIYLEKEFGERSIFWLGKALFNLSLTMDGVLIKAEKEDGNWKISNSYYKMFSQKTKTVRHGIVNLKDRKIIMPMKKYSIDNFKGF